MTSSPGIKTYHRIILSVLSAVLLFLSFMDLGFFAWFALILFFFSIYGAGIKKSILFSFICGAGFFAGMTYWMVELYVKYTWPLLVSVLSLYFIIFGIAAYYILNRVDKPYIRLVLLPAVWILIEFARSQTFMAFTIGILGYSQHNFLPLMQVTRFTGIYGISFLILFFNAALYETIKPVFEQRKLEYKYLAISMSLLILLSAYGMYSVDNNLDRNIAKNDYEKLEIAAVQPRILFGTKYSNKGFEIIPEEYSSQDHFKPGTDLVIFPESALWGNKSDNDDFFKWAQDVLEGKDMWMVMGQYTHDSSGKVWANSTVLYDSGLKEVGRYDEIHPVPFSQYMPHPRILGFLKFLDFSIVDLRAGDSYEPLVIEGYGQLAFNICYESTLPYISRRFRDSGAEAIIVSSDDSSLNESIAPWHHLIFSKVRAIENGCYVIHCGNTGFSAIISPAGNIIKKLDLMDKDVLYGTVYLIPQKTFYAEYGNILLYIYLILSVITAAAYIIWKRKKIK